MKKIIPILLSIVVIACFFSGCQTNKERIILFQPSLVV